MGAEEALVGVGAAPAQAAVGAEEAPAPASERLQAQAPAAQAPEPAEAARTAVHRAVAAAGTRSAAACRGRPQAPGKEGQLVRPVGASQHFLTVNSGGAKLKARLHDWRRTFERR